MALEVQRAVLALVEDVAGVSFEREACPEWLRRPGRVECAKAWVAIAGAYAALTGQVLPETAPPREHRRVDAVWVGADGTPRVVEVDEVQHFTPARAITLRHYPPSAVTAYDRTTWLARSEAATRLPGGGFARPRPPLFPEEGGRHLQRAFRDMLADLLPPEHGWAPTLRIGDFEVKSWLGAPGAHERMSELVRAKLSAAG